MLDAHLPFLPSPPESPPESLSPLAGLGAPPAAHSVLVLEPDDVRNADLVAPSSNRVVYSIRTDGRGDRTDVRLAAAAGYGDAPPALASVNRKSFAPSVSLHGDTLAIKRWLRTSLNKDTGVTFQARSRLAGTQSYQWRPNALGQLTLYTGEKPIAWFTRSRKLVVDGQSTSCPAYLALEPEAELIRNDVVVSFLIVEESLRMQAMKRGFRV